MYFDLNVKNRKVKFKTDQLDLSRRCSVDRRSWRLHRTTYYDISGLMYKLTPDNHGTLHPANLGYRRIREILVPLTTQYISGNKDIEQQ